MVSWRAIGRALSTVSFGSMLALTAVGPVSAQAIEDFSLIQATPITLTPDAGGRSAVLEVDTTIDAACSVVYGPDETFGMIAVDSDMGSGAHAEHHPVLGDLEPDTEYLYRLQGTAADGTIYVSDVMSFRTPVAPIGGPADLALDGVVTGVSSEFSDAYAAANAFDGDPNTEWSSAGDGDDAWVEIDLGAAQHVATVEFRTRSMADGSSITETIGITADGESLGEFEANTAVPVNRQGRVWRFDVVTSSGGNTGAVEILLLGAG